MQLLWLLFAEYHVYFLRITNRGLAVENSFCSASEKQTKTTPFAIRVATQDYATKNEIQDACDGEYNNDEGE